MTEDLKQTLTQIIALKKADGSTEQYQQLLANASLLAIKIRLGAKQVVGETERIKVETAALRDEADQHDMLLQSLLYEKNHYNKEIASCRSFRYHSCSPQQNQYIPFSPLYYNLGSWHRVSGCSMRLSQYSVLHVIVHVVGVAPALVPFPLLIPKYVPVTSPQECFV